MRYHERKAQQKGFKVIAGVDEAGRGPLAGPVVAGCVILGKKRFSCLIKDSKVLSPRQRLISYLEITETSQFSVGIVDEQTIDRINIYQATILAMEEAIRSIKTQPDFILIDGGVKLNIPHPHVHIKGGDAKSVSIAAASIIAKVTRDNLMLKYDSLYPQYGFARHKGYGTKEHFKALEKYGPSPIHRKTFAPVSNFNQT
ncbi:MAG: ribonuclease HII [Candidatus Omnitrophica bacterium CG07_land_8_20_14_0_80_42_15]|uniref:Ribonuclease HII n=1 Tax=Candidatus Aquitaenariimonas noxiae TaxID=1974741 RepID=A0A2J0KXL2_9BACT|nr:MAG: ribonuclease HII [Candidatus Omnitrophica bacterium CG07_land_8_20_14_0_80_42_15]